MGIKVRLLPSPEDQVVGAISFWMIAFQGMAARSLRRHSCVVDDLHLKMAREGIYNCKFSKKILLEKGA